MIRLSSEFWAQPFAHRGLHDTAAGRAENSLEAITAAIDAGYAIEIDIQPSADGEAMVFHDDNLNRLTAQKGRIDARTTDALRSIALTNGGGDTIPTLEETLDLIRGRVPLLIEIKDQSGGFTKTNGALERRVCALVRDAGQVESCAIMSFNPFSAEHVRDALPDIARGVVSYDFQHPHDAHIAADHRADLAALKWFEKAGADFISYGATSLPSERTQALRAEGVPVFCWTICSAQEAHDALEHCDQVTFEGYLPT